MMDAQLRPYFSPKAVQMAADVLVFSKAVEAVDAQLHQKLFVDMDISASEFVRPWSVFHMLNVMRLASYLRLDMSVCSIVNVGSRRCLPVLCQMNTLIACGISISMKVNFLLPVSTELPAHLSSSLLGPPFLFRVGLALLLFGRQDILACRDKSQLLAYLLSPPVAALPSDPDSLINNALSLRLKDDDIKKQRTKLEVQMRRQTQGPSRSGTSSNLTISLPRS